MSSNYVKVVCPKCKKELSISTITFICDNCNLSYPVLQGIPYFLTDINDEFKLLQKRYYEKDNFITKLHLVKFAIDRVGFNLPFTLKAAKLCNIIYSLNCLPRTKVLDIGCRDARLLNKLKLQFQTDNYGVDISVKQLQENVRNNPLNNFYFVSDAEFLPFAKDSFDFIFCLDVLEHLPNPQKCLSEVAYVLKENGQALFYAISKKRKYTWGWFLEKITGGRLGKDKREIHQEKHYLNPEETINWCKLYGIKVEKIIFFHSFFSWAFDSLILKILENVSLFLNKLTRKNIPDEKISAEKNSSKTLKYKIIFFFLRNWSLIIRCNLYICEFMDRLWNQKGYSSGFFLLLKKNAK